MALIRSAGVCIAVCLLGIVGMFSVLRPRPPYNEHIAYTQQRPLGEINDLYVMDPQRYQATQLASDVDSHFLLWSPNSSQLAFHRMNAVYGLCVMTMDDPQEYCPSYDGVGYVWYQHPSWTPNGKWLTVVQHSGTSRAVGRVPPQRIEFHPMLQNDELLGASAWSADGKWLFLLSGRNTSDISLHRMNTRDFTLSTLATVRDFAINSIRLSPDGKWLVIGQISPVILSTDGTPVQSPMTLLDWFEWTPDNYILTSNVTSNGLYLIDPRTATSQTIASNLPAYVLSATTSPDGQLILFSTVDAEENNFSLYRIRRDGTGLQRIRSLEAPIYKLAWSRPLDLPWHSNRLLGAAIGLLVLVVVSWWRR